MNNTNHYNELELSYLSHGKKVIPLVYEFETLTVTDIKIPDLILTNRSTETLTPLKIEVTGRNKETPVASFYLSEKRTRSLIRQVNPQFKQKLTADATTRDEFKFQIKTSFGEFEIEGNRLSDDEILKPSQSAIALLSLMMYFHNVGTDPIDTLDISVYYQRNNEQQVSMLSIPINCWQSEIQYQFPLRGSVWICDLPLNYLHHRSCQSQEFGMDIMEVHPDSTGKLTTSRKTNPSSLADYYTYQKPVHAAADGIVVEAADCCPEEETIDPWEWSHEKSLANIAELSKSIGFKNAAAGNYLVIQHAEGEYAFYAHLSEHTIKVKAGDRVKSGQIIAQAGSTGNSSEPHLHFQLMDSPDIFTANGLPVMFNEIKAEEMNQCYRKANSLMCSDNIFISISEEDEVKL